MVLDEEESKEEEEKIAENDYGREVLYVCLGIGVVVIIAVFILNLCSGRICKKKAE